MAEEQTTNQFADVLRDPRVEAVKDIFNRLDLSAIAAQGRYKQFSAIFIVATAVAALTAALILFGLGAGDDGAGHPAAAFFAREAFRNILFGVEVAALAVAAFAAHIQESRQHSARWARERRSAELCRIEYFDTLLAVADEKGPQTQLAGFDHFVKEQLTHQLTYFEKAGARHYRRANRLAIGGAVGAALVAIAGATANSTFWLPIVAMAGVVAPIVLTAVSSFRDTGNDQDNATRYGDMWTALRRVKGQTGLVRDKLVAGDAAPMHALVTEVHDLLRAENKVWTAAGQE